MQAIEILKYEKELKDAGVPDNQAQIHASKLALIIEDNIVTKKDIADIRSDIAKLDIKLDAMISAIDKKLDWLTKLITIGGTLIAAIASIPPVISIFFK